MLIAQELGHAFFSLNASMGEIFSMSSPVEATSTELMGIKPQLKDIYFLFGVKPIYVRYKSVRTSRFGGAGTLKSFPNVATMCSFFPHDAFAIE